MYYLWESSGYDTWRLMYDYHDMLTPKKKKKGKHLMQIQNSQG